MVGLARRDKLEKAVQQRGIAGDLQLPRRDAPPQEQQEVGGGSAHGYVAVAVLTTDGHLSGVEARQLLAPAVGLVKESSSHQLSASLHKCSSMHS